MRISRTTCKDPPATSRRLPAPAPKRATFSNEQTAFIVQHKPSFFRAPASSPGLQAQRIPFHRRPLIAEGRSPPTRRDRPPARSRSRLLDVIPTVTKTCQRRETFRTPSGFFSRPAGVPDAPPDAALPLGSRARSAWAGGFRTRTLCATSEEVGRGGGSSVNVILAALSVSHTIVRLYPLYRHLIVRLSTGTAPEIMFTVLELKSACTGMMDADCILRASASLDDSEGCRGPRSRTLR
ncbi:hypothetical protein C8Q70DRAFT_42840 [Cubamyces menziesii]|nr:hypothetical protein C8Q70DRAFT_42840 [Cubamyces menziesii]